MGSGITRAPTSSSSAVVTPTPMRCFIASLMRRTILPPARSPWAQIGRACRVEAKKSLENLLPRFGWNTRTAIPHGQRIFGSRAPAGDADLPTLGGELEGIVEQVHHEPAQQRLVGMDGHLAI